MSATSPRIRRHEPGESSDLLAHLSRSSLLAELHDGPALTDDLDELGGRAVRLGDEQAAHLAALQPELALQLLVVRQLGVLTLMLQRRLELGRLPYVGTRGTL